MVWHPVRKFFWKLILLSPEDFLRAFIIILSGILIFASWLAYGASWNKIDPLFFIERNKTKNLVRYDVQLLENNDLPDSNPVVVYWVLENGQKEDLSLIQRKYAYGIDSQEKPGRNRFRILLAALKERKIIVEKIGGFYKAIVFISGKPSVLEKVFVESEERLAGLPKVLYIDLFGRTQKTDLPIKERIIPD